MKMINMNIIREVAKGIIFCDEMFLLQLRDNKPEITNQNKWAFFGGEIEKGETPWQALKREIKEELEWEPQKGEFLYDWINPEDPCRIHFFAIPFTGNSQELILHEGQSFGWFSFSEIKNMHSVAFSVVQNLTRALSILG